MKHSFWTAGSAAAALVVVAGQLFGTSPDIFLQLTRLGGPQLGDDSEYTPPKVPQYNVSMPLDHFNASDRRTFINRFWVNDTYYKPGGPVILADFGEGTVMDDMVATILAEWGGHVATAPMELARELGGVAMVLEHRYYGYSQPFKLTSTTSYSTNDLPVGGPKDYQYLSVEQALEDVVYFASRHISQADLNLNTVLAAPNATWQLHPSRTPWIWASGSYGGSRGVWLRIRNPEVIYAVWASSAPVECRPDGSAYFNSIYRSMASNCSADVQAVVRHVDRVLSDDEDSRGAALDLKASVYMASNYAGLQGGNQGRDGRYDLRNMLLAENLARDVAANATRLSPVHVARLLIEPLSLLFQSFGPSATVHRFCDYMQRFDTAAYRANTRIDDGEGDEHINIAAAGAKTNTSRDDALARRLFRTTAFMNARYTDNGGAAPSAQGIVASHSSSSSSTPGTSAVELALAAYLHAVWRSKADVADVVGSDFRFLPLDRDAHAWAWQTWTETGMVPHVDAASPLALGSKFLGYAAARASFVNNTVFSQTTAPETTEDGRGGQGGFPPAAPPDPRFVAALGGWHMRPSNVMFTHGEFDPWRAFSVSSLDQHLGAPRRRLVAGAAIPKCNRPPPGTDVFGLLHAGAAHSQDMVGLRGGGAGDEGRYFDHASQLFLKALREEWLPCFNATAV